MVNHPINVGSVIRRVLNIYVSQVYVLLPAAAIVVAIIGISDTRPIANSPALALVASIIVLAVIALFAGMVVALVADVWGGRRNASIGQLLRIVRPVFGQLVLVGIAAGIAIGFLFSVASLIFIIFFFETLVGFGPSIASIIGGGLVGIVLGLVPGLFLITVWSVAAPVVMVEHPGGLRALGRSRELVRGNRWRVFGIIFVLMALLGGVGYVIEMGAGTLGSAPASVVKVLIGIVAAPIPVLAVAVLYFELSAASVSESVAP